MAKGATMDGSDAISTNFIVAAGTATVLLGSCLAYVVSKSKGQKK